MTFFVAGQDNANSTGCTPLNVVALPRSTCGGYVACEAAMCNCSLGTYVNQACTFGAPSCALLGTCLAAYVQCFKVLIVTATQQTTDCSSWAYRAYTDLLAALAGGTLTELQQSCEWQVCVIRNLTQTSAPLCPNINGPTLCDFTRVGDAFTTTLTPGTMAPFTPTPPEGAAVVVGTFSPFATVTVVMLALWAAS